MVNVPTANDRNTGDLARVKSIDLDDSWPKKIEIAAYFADGKRKSIEISSEKFYGRGEYGAPMSGDELIFLINKIRTSR